jgi:hypothetical protein
MFLADFKSQHYAAIFLPPCKSIRTKFPILANNQKSPLDFSGRLIFLAEFNFQLSTAILLPPQKSTNTKFPTLANNQKSLPDCSGRLS